MTFAATIALAACSGGKPQPAQTDDRILCACTCEQQCNASDVQIDHDAVNDPINQHCTTTSSGFGGPVGDGSIIVPMTRQGCGTPGNYGAACAQQCPKLTSLKVFDPGSNKDIFVPLALNCAASTTAQPTLDSPHSCNVAQFSLTAGDAVSNYNTASMSMQPSSSLVRIQSGEAFFDIPNAGSGPISLQGGNCPGRSCDVSINRAVLVAPPFSDPFTETNVGETTVVNDATIVGTKAANGQLTFPAANLKATASSSLNGVLVNSILEADAPMTGTYDPVTGLVNLTATFSQNGQSLFFSLNGQTTARPPIANAGADQTAACTAGGKPTVTVDASQSFDPDGDAISFVWSKAGVPFASTAVASVQVGSGTTDLTVTVTDATGRIAQDSTRITVSDAIAPVFTFVPPTVVVETSGPVNIGQAQASDSCGGTVTVTNNAPASFPIGRTVVTWRATDPSGNAATATQLVLVLPPIAASCPAGSHIILGTSNNDVLIGTEGPDCIIGFGGQDRIEGRGGNDTLLGGEGDDIILGGGGDDVIVGGGGQDNCSGEAGNDIVAGANGDDVLSGGDGADTLVGGDGQDRMTGDAGNDTLVGNAGDDTMNGGAGIDRCVADLGHDTLIACE